MSSALSLTHIHIDAQCLRLIRMIASFYGISFVGHVQLVNCDYCDNCDNCEPIVLAEGDLSFFCETK